MRSLQLNQQYDEIETTTARNKTSEGKEYSFPSVEKHLVHAEMETPSYNPTTGEKTSTPTIQKFYPKDFERMEKQGSFAGMKVVILHDPTTSDSGTQIKEVNPEDSQQPQIMSQPGAGTPLTQKVQDLDDKRLKEVYQNFYPDADPKKLPKREEMIADILDRAAILGDEAKTDELRQQWENRLRALGLM